MMDIYGLNWDSRLKYIYPHYLFRIFKKKYKNCTRYTCTVLVEGN
jgi:hypothetical protein